MEKGDTDFFTFAKNIFNKGLQSKMRNELSKLNKMKKKKHRNWSNDLHRYFTNENRKMAYEFIKR